MRFHCMLTSSLQIDNIALLKFGYHRRNNADIILDIGLSSCRWKRNEIHDAVIFF